VTCHQFLLIIWRQWHHWLCHVVYSEGLALVPSACILINEILLMTTVKTKRLKLKSPNVRTGIIHHDTSPTNEGQRSRSQGHKVHNVVTRQPCGTVLKRLCRRATVVSSSYWKIFIHQKLKAIEWSASVKHSIECTASVLYKLICSKPKN